MATLAAAGGFDMELMELTELTDELFWAEGRFEPWGAGFWGAAHGDEVCTECGWLGHEHEARPSVAGELVVLPARVEAPEPVRKAS